MKIEDKIVCEDTLPAGLGVSPGEVGEPGPWYGVVMPEGYVFGWYREKRAAERKAAVEWAGKEAKP